jgi:type II secretory pathway component PulM
MLSPGTLLPLAAPALPLDEAGKYVAGAYVVFLVLIVVYVAIMAAKLQRIERELKELAGFAESRAARDQAIPGRGSGRPSISDSVAAHGSRGDGV